REAEGVGSGKTEGVGFGETEGGPPSETDRLLFGKKGGLVFGEACGSNAKVAAGRAHPGSANRAAGGRDRTSAGDGVAFASASASGRGSRASCPPARSHADACTQIGRTGRHCGNVVDLEGGSRHARERHRADPQAPSR